MRWLQERPGGVFLVATCNDVDTLPPELLRRGRFDEVFFVDLPVPSGRAAIIELHLRQRHRVPSLFDLMTLAAASDGFTGAELEAAVVGGLYGASADGRRRDGRSARGDPPDHAALQDPGGDDRGLAIVGAGPGHAGVRGGRASAFGR